MFFLNKNDSYMKRICYFVCLLLAASACSEGPEKKVTKARPEPISPEDQSLWANTQTYFQPITGPAESANNPITEEKVALGKMLYYDTRLSKTGNNSCNSCHNLATHGVDNRSFSLGDAGKPGGRNSPTVLNAAFANMQFWDGRAKDVEEQAGMPILNPAEMAIPSKEFLVQRLKSTKEYPSLFASAFPNDPNPLSYENLQKAIGAFERTLVTPTRFDDFVGKNPSYLNKEEKEGLALFINTGCTQCHAGKGIGGGQLQKFGVYGGSYTQFTKSAKHDPGRKEVTGSPSDEDVFKVPTLRNVAKTAPYFHDGSVSNLNDAIRIMAKTQLNKELSDAEVQKIEVFLNALTGEVPKAAL
jgi:cytochrome c peroxidase